MWLLSLYLMLLKIIKFNMQRNLLSLACCLILLGGAGQQADAQRLLSSQQTKYVDGKVRVKLQPEIAERLSKALLPTGA